MQMAADEEKIVIIATHGGEDPDRATLPFVVANAAQAMDTKAVVILQGYAVTLATAGCYEHVFAPNMPPLKELVDSYVKQGGELLVCTPCLQTRQIAPEALIAGAKPIAAGRVVQECLEAKATLNY
jgi:predicted peroxiredoxin